MPAAPSSGATPAVKGASSNQKSQPALVPAAAAMPLAPQVKGARPRVNTKVLAPAATSLAPGLEDLAAPPSLGLPVKPSQVRIQELRPISMRQAENLAEVNNPNLKAVASQVEQAQSNLRARIALWYPSLSLGSNALPSYLGGESSTANRNNVRNPNPNFNRTTASIWQMDATLRASWQLIDPSRTPTIAAARDEFEKAKNQYLIALRELRLQVAQTYLDLQQADDGVRIGQESVRASLVSLRDAKARFQAGVATKLEVLQAETQLARDQQVLTGFLSSQSITRRVLAAQLDLPQTITPTASDPSLVLGVWSPSLQESIVAAYAFREELDQALLDISIANSNANAQLAQSQPFLSIVNSLSAGRSNGYTSQSQSLNQDLSGQYSWSVNNSIGLTFDWRLFDGGAARARYRQEKQRAQENVFRFADRRDSIRRDVEESFYELEKNNRNITTTAQEVLSARESLRLARLRFQAGVTTQREVVDTQRDLTQAEVRYSSAISDYNKRLVELQRRTGLDQIASCSLPTLPANKPVGSSAIPVEPSPLIPGCQAGR
ncbi:MAG TPA: TolC family protein [Synechococcales bacterium UBA10510]|nr:TolC family protein [Synechococcales bacterium UBA10510]